MIYMRVEMWPMGLRSRARLLGEATLANIGGDAAHGDYDVKLSKFGGFKGRRPKPSAEGTLFAESAYADTENLRVCAPLASSIWKAAVVKHLSRTKRGYWDIFYQGLWQIARVRNARTCPVPRGEAEGGAIADPCVFGRVCEFHDFEHGEEANELRTRLEQFCTEHERKKSARDLQWFDVEDALEERERLLKELRALLEDVDARDSQAFLEARSEREAACQQE